MPGTQRVGITNLPCRPSRLYRRGVQKVPEGFQTEYRQQPSRTPPPGNCVHPKNCLFAGSEAGGQRRTPVFIRRNMQSEQHLVSQVAKKHSASFEFHSGRAD